MRTTLLPVAAFALLVCSCNPIEEWEQNPALVRSKAELAGGAVVYTYFSAKPEAKAGAKHMRVVIQSIEGIVDSFPTEGFNTFLPEVNKKLEELMTGEAAVYLPPAKLLASILLETLQQKAEKDHWFDDADAVSDILSAFLSGADDAMAAYVKPDQ
jgi:hypothetical protein